MADDPEDRFLAPIESAHTPSLFAFTVFKGWSVKLSGFLWAIICLGVGFIFNAYAGFILVAFGGIGVYVVCFQMWKAERLRNDSITLKLKAAEVELDKALKKSDTATSQAIAALAMKDTRPQIVGFLTEIHILQWYKEDIHRPGIQGLIPVGLRVLLDAAFINESVVQTSIHNFSLTMMVRDEKMLFSRKAEMPLGLYDDQTIKREFDNLEIFVLDENLLTTQGRRNAGHLEFLIPDATFEDLGEYIDMTLHIEDSFGDEHNISKWRLRSPTTNV